MEYLYGLVPETCKNGSNAIRNYHIRSSETHRFMFVLLNKATRNVKLLDLLFNCFLI